MTDDRVEWAVVRHRSNYRPSTEVVQGDLGDRTEAERWLIALETTELRQEEEMRRTMPMVDLPPSSPLQVACRRVGPWTAGGT